MWKTTKLTIWFNFFKFISTSNSFTGKNNHVDGIVHDFQITRNYQALEVDLSFSYEKFWRMHFFFIRSLETIRVERSTYEFLVSVQQMNFRPLSHTGGIKLIVWKDGEERGRGCKIWICFLITHTWLDPGWR